MYRKHVTQFLLASSLALGLGPLAANAQPTGGEGMGHHRGHSMMGLRNLNLTEAQRDQVFKIYHEQAPAVHEQMKQVQRSRQDLRQLAMADRFDEGRARQIADTQAKALSALAVMRAQTMARVREILTPDQRQRLDQSRERRANG
jgi:Spy/CpxP family protein refolding chaperone